MVVFQNLVQIPAMQHAVIALNTAEVLPPPLYLASGGTRGESHSVTAKPGQQFIVTIDIPGDANTAFVGELYDAAGSSKLSLTIPESASKESLSLRMPGDLPGGNYTLVVKKAAASRIDRSGTLCIHIATAVTISMSERGEGWMTARK